MNQPFTSEGHKLNNAVGRLSGKSTSLYTVGGHIDAINGGSDGDNQSGKAAPGANDDGSGVVVAMEAGRVLKAWQPCMKSSIDFVGFNDEEEESGGSEKYVKSISSKSFKGLYNIDMVGYMPKELCLINRYDNTQRDKPLLTKLNSVNKKYAINMKMKSAIYHEDDTDTYSFWDENKAGLYLNECTDDEDYPGYHSVTDKTSFINYTALAKTTKLMVAALAELSAK